MASPPATRPSRLVFAGGGKMAEALIGGLIATGWADAAQLAVVEPLEARRVELANVYPGLRFLDAPDGPDVLVAVKPHHVEEVAATFAAGGVERVLSIAAGVTVASLESWSPPGTRVVRAMPNTPSLVGHGAAAIAAGTAVKPADLDWARSILASVGTVEVVDESALDAVTGLSGSGPAYVFLVAEALISAGTSAGLAPDVADRLARQTLIGAATLLRETGEDPAVLRQNVTSPGGTTAEGLRVLEDADLRGLFERTVAAATARSIELGQA